MGTLGKRPQPGEPRPATPQAKPNRDNNRSLPGIELALADHFNWKKNVITIYDPVMQKIEHLRKE